GGEPFGDDDELVFMAKDTGPRIAPACLPDDPSATEIEVRDRRRTTMTFNGALLESACGESEEYGGGGARVIGFRVRELPEAGKRVVGMGRPFGRDKPL